MEQRHVVGSASTEEERRRVPDRGELTEQTWIESDVGRAWQRMNEVHSKCFSKSTFLQ